MVGSVASRAGPSKSHRAMYAQRIHEIEHLFGAVKSWVMFAFAMHTRVFRAGCLPSASNNANENIFISLGISGNTSSAAGFKIASNFDSRPLKVAYFCEAY